MLRGFLVTLTCRAGRCPWRLLCGDPAPTALQGLSIYLGSTLGWQERAGTFNKASWTCHTTQHGPKSATHWISRRVTAEWDLSEPNEASDTGPPPSALGPHGAFNEWVALTDFLPALRCSPPPKGEKPAAKASSRYF